MKYPKYAAVVVHGISDKAGDQQAGFSNELSKTVISDQAIRDKYWLEAIWEPINNALDDKIQDVVLQLISSYDKTTYWRDSELAKAKNTRRKICVWAQWCAWKWFVSWCSQKTTRALDLVLDLPMYLGNPKGKMIRNKVKEAIDKALSITNEGIVLIGHSLGSVIAYDVIQESLSENGAHFPIKAFISMGSPLAWVTDLRVADKEVLDQPFHIGNIPWYNFYDKNDPVAFMKELPPNRFPSVKNMPAICSGERYIKAHTIYWQREEVARKVSELIF